MKCDKLEKWYAGQCSPSCVVYGANEVDATIAELKSENERLKAKLESVQASAYADSVDAGMRERRLRRALWIARANSAEGQFFYWCARFGVESGFTKADIRGSSVNTKRRLRTIGEWIEMWKNVERKCLKKADQYR